MTTTVSGVAVCVFGAIGTWSWIGVVRWSRACSGSVPLTCRSASAPAPPRLAPRRTVLQGLKKQLDATHLVRQVRYRTDKPHCERDDSNYNDEQKPFFKIFDTRGDIYELKK